MPKSKCRPCCSKTPALNALGARKVVAAGSMAGNSGASHAVRDSGPRYRRFWCGGEWGHLARKLVPELGGCSS